jgi:alpha-glucosidase
VESGGKKVIEGWEILPRERAASVDLRSGEHVYGFGDKRAALDQRGQTVAMQNKDAFASETNDSYKSVPFFFTDRGYGLFAHNPFTGQFDVGKSSPNRVEWKANGGEADFYVFLGETPKDILSEYTRLTGRPELMPRWFFGFHQSKASYADLEARNVARTMRAKKLPFDTIYYDDWSDAAAKKRFLDEMHQKYHARLTFGGNPFLIGESRFLHQMGTEKHLLSTRDGKAVIEGAREIADENGQNSDVVGYIDFFNGAAAKEFVRHEWASHLKDGVVLGMADFGELDNLDDAVKKVWPSVGLPASDTRLIYSLAYADGLIEGARKVTGGRSTGMIRPGTAGTQRYGWTTTGDSLPTFQNFRGHLRGLLNLSLSGFSNIGYDIGGFASKGPDEVYARWFAAATFNPFMWAHGQGDHEPYSHGQEVESMARKFLELRYRLVPFFYSLNDVAHRQGTPILRALPLEEPGDPESSQVTDQFFVGDSLLVAPVTDPKGRSVHLPPGTWHDFWGERAPEQGPGRVERPDVPLDRIPVFVRAGSIVPFGPTMQYTGEKPTDPLEVHFFAFSPAEVEAAPRSTSFDLYEDDGESRAFEHGVFSRTRITATEDAHTLRFELKSVDGGTYRPAPHTLRFVLRGLGAVPSAVQVDGVVVPRADGAAPAKGPFWQLTAQGPVVVVPSASTPSLSVRF